MNFGPLTSEVDRSLSPSQRWPFVAPVWMLHDQADIAPIIAPRTLAHYNERLCAVEIVLTPEVLQRFDVI